MAADFSWMEETVTDVPYNKRLYRFMCFFLGKRKKKLKYREVYMILWALNRKDKDDIECKKKALEKVIELYQYLNNKLPEGIERHL